MDHPLQAAAMRRGKSTIAQKGPYKGDELSADHIIETPQTRPSLLPRESVVSFAQEAGDKMSMMQTISVESGFLRANVAGNFSLEEAQRTFIEILEAVARSKVEKVLLDGRGIAGNPEVMERFYYGEFAAESVGQFTAYGVSQTTRFAYVLEEPVRDPGRFTENVAVNRGMVARTFDDYQDALAWLLTPPANKSAATGAK